MPERGPGLAKCAKGEVYENWPRAVRWWLGAAVSDGQFGARREREGSESPQGNGCVKQREGSDRKDAQVAASGARRAGVSKGGQLMRRLLAANESFV